MEYLEGSAPAAPLAGKLERLPNHLLPIASGPERCNVGEAPEVVSVAAVRLEVLLLRRLFSCGIDCLGLGKQCGRGAVRQRGDGVPALLADGHLGVP